MRKTGKAFPTGASSECRCPSRLPSKSATVQLKWVSSSFPCALTLPTYYSKICHLHGSCSVQSLIVLVPQIAANNLGVDAIFVYTKHGNMASLLSRNRPNSPIFAFTDVESTRMALTLQWGVIPLFVDLTDDMEANITKSVNLLKTKGMIREGDAVLVVSDVTPTCSASSTAFQSIQVKTIS